MKAFVMIRLYIEQSGGYSDCCLDLIELGE